MIFRHYELIETFFTRTQTEHCRYDDIVPKRLHGKIDSLLLEIGTVALIWHYLNKPLWKYLSSPKSSKEVKQVLSNIVKTLNEQPTVPFIGLIRLRNKVFSDIGIEIKETDLADKYKRKWTESNDAVKTGMKEYFDETISRIIEKIEKDWNLTQDVDLNDDILELGEQEVWSNQLTERIFSQLRRHETIDNLSDGNLKQCTIASNNQAHEWIKRLPTKDFSRHLTIAMSPKERKRAIELNKKETTVYLNDKYVHYEQRKKQEEEKKRRKLEKAERRLAREQGTSKSTRNTRSRQTKK